MLEESSTLGLSKTAFSKIVKEKLLQICAEKWKNEVTCMPTLKTYDDNSQELIHSKNMPINNAISKIRSETFQIKIEIERYRSKPLSEILCNACEIEDVLCIAKQVH